LGLTSRFGMGLGRAPTL